MVDCRLCKKHYTIFRSETDENENTFVCLAKGVLIDPQHIAKGPCDLYVDVDGYNTEE